LGAAVGLVPVLWCCLWTRCVRWVCGLRSLLLPRAVLCIRLKTWLCRLLSHRRLRRLGRWLGLLHWPDLLIQRRTVGQLLVTLLRLSWAVRFNTTLGVTALLRRCLFAR